MGDSTFHIARFAEKKEKVREYLGTPRSERMPLPAFRKEMGIHRNQFLNLKFAIEEEEKAISRKNTRSVQENLLKGLEGEIDDDPVGWWQSKRLEINKAILDSAKRGNAQSQKLAKQLAGELIEKAEVKIGLSAEELYRRYLEEQRQLSEFRDRLGVGTEKVPE